ncbi:uncharacterized protein BYT42DRAFT_315012 [Radiomyces spectabilis]|uniref:uncharacterized protein n=1 Tax=Radiomyces spectabilis TaxID=64574 RepID=UPI00221EEF6A|nr:uncharacterized protein BYT42DRAFT_315012 [Radiomyces spectabilis]KAI8379146.1 hypothetical protein BYT42DRAFT_315012 [Radiomyces spectabilis]
MWELWTQYYQLSRYVQSILLGLFSLLVAMILAYLTAKLLYPEGLLVLLMSIAGVSSLLLYTWQPRYSFSGAKPLLCTLIAICSTSPWLRSKFEIDPLQILWPIFWSALLNSYLVLDLYYMMGGVTVDDYLLVNLLLFIDIIYPLRCLHHICELTDNLEVFPDIFNPDSQ